MLPLSTREGGRMYIPESFQESKFPSDSPDFLTVRPCVMLLTGETPGSEVESLESGRWFDAHWVSRPSGLSGLQCSAQDASCIHIRVGRCRVATSLCHLAVLGTWERRGGGHWSRVSSEGIALGPGISEQAGLRS